MTEFTLSGQHNPAARNFRHLKHIDGWILATQLCEAYIKSPSKADSLLGKLPLSISPSDRRRCQFLFLGVIRNLSRIASATAILIKKEPRPRLKSILFVASAELLSSGEDKTAKIINHAVEQAKNLLSPAEVKFVNAVLRKAVDLLKNPRQMVSGGGKLAFLSLEYSHPEWLVRRWERAFGLDVVEKILRWNQKPPPIYLNFPANTEPGGLDGLESTKWPGFLRISTGEKVNIGEIVNKFGATVMDPASANPVKLLAVEPYEKVLDLCAAPGGKSSLIANQLEKEDGFLVSLDLSGPRMSLLHENLNRFSKSTSVIVEADLLKTTSDDLGARNLPRKYDAVLLDAPCSNTGVLRRRPDARWRLRPEDIASAAAKQLKMLCRAVSFVTPNGRILYSTCSIEEEENRGVVDKFLHIEKGHWKLQTEASYTPWNDDCDGGSAFLLVPVES